MGETKGSGVGVMTEHGRALSFPIIYPKNVAGWIRQTVHLWPWYAAQGRVPVGVYGGRSILWYRWDNNEFNSREWK
jgi:hypothetical protein